VCAACISAPVHMVLPHPSLYVGVWRRHKHGKLVYKKLRQENIQVLINALASSARTNVNLPRSETQVRLCALRETQRERRAATRPMRTSAVRYSPCPHRENGDALSSVLHTHTVKEREAHAGALREFPPLSHTHIYIHRYAAHTLLACVIYTSYGRLY
jgi:hypothetical protein